jgi:farnesyl-diphosphate farnesyltransferase
MTSAQNQHHYLLTDLLKGVSRSFYLTIRILPKSVRDPIATAYLLARAADTIADKSTLPHSTRLSHLKTIRASLDAADSSAGHLEDLKLDAGSLADAREAELLEALPRLFRLLENLPQDDRQNVRKVVTTLTHGMEMDLTTFPNDDSGSIGALHTLNDLDQYTYQVAGCVGEFWTDVMMAHTDTLHVWDRERMVALGIRFGKALQMTNILRDVPKDLRIGRCYLPREELDLIGLVPEDLLPSLSTATARPLLVKLTRQMLDHYAAAEQYIFATPRQNFRLRLAMIWPVLIGLATLSLVTRNPDWLDPDRPSKVSRPWIYWMMFRSVPCAWSNTLFKFWVRRLRAGVEKAL